MPSNRNQLVQYNLRLYNVNLYTHCILFFYFLGRGGGQGKVPSIYRLNYYRNIIRVGWRFPLLSLVGGNGNHEIM